MSSRVEENVGYLVEREETESANLGYSSASAHSYDQHRRSKCGYEKKLNRLPLRVEDSYCTKNESHEVVHCTSSCRASPLHKNSYGIKEHDSSNHRASLEKDIEQLQLHLQQEKCMRLILEKAMGRASSTLSPGHRHFSAETKQLIAEIEFLEEEVANREQQVLSLYKNIFEQCVSRPASVATSPSHVKRESRKHPGIISTAFCSPFPLRRFHSLAFVNIDSGKRNLSKTKRASSKDNMDIEKSFVNHIKAPITRRSNSPTRTLKDHMYQCPSKLAAEMVRCMAAVYCWLRTSSSPKTAEQGFSHQPSSTNVILRQWKVVKDDKYWSTKSAVEIPWISTDKAKFSRVSYAISSYRILVEQLENVNVRQMDASAQIAFWINLYNSLVMHAYLAFGIPHSSLRRLALFHKAAYNVGGLVVSANTIEQSIFCCRTLRMGQWFEIVLSTAMKKRSAEERKLICSNYGLQNFQPLVCFALCTGTYSDPLLNVYTAENIKEELEAAKEEFLESNLVVKKSKTVYLPKLIEKYAKEAGIAVDDIVDWVLENVDEKLHDLIKRCCESRPKKKIIKWLPYYSRFRYVLSKELTENPWCV